MRENENAPTPRFIITSAAKSAKPERKSTPLLRRTFLVSNSANGAISVTLSGITKSDGAARAVLRIGNHHEQRA